MNRVIRVFFRAFIYCRGWGAVAITVDEILRLKDAILI